MDKHGGHNHGGEHAPHDASAFHGMAVVGEDAVFLSHLPMRHRPHNSQMVLRGSMGSFADAYHDDRMAHPETRLYTFAPEVFVLSDLLPGPDGGAPARTSFSGSLFRNHFEQPPAHPEPPFEVASDVVVDVSGVVYHHTFAPEDQQSEQLTYILFGEGLERFLAHRITGPFRPESRQEFDHLLAIGVRGQEGVDEQLRSGAEVTVTGRPNEPDTRLREREKVAAVAVLDGREIPVEIDVRADLYFDTADLAVPH
ncbi:hypothetical protein ABZS86_04325 [Streptomyces sp. NPDC005355]|uniref:hypothetical protein n=1 Tax=Streptomyces sp. NPDC005355 TaxID=3157038 RepID=UPI0033AEC499